VRSCRGLCPSCHWQKPAWLLHEMPAISRLGSMPVPHLRFDKGPRWSGRPKRPPSGSAHRSAADPAAAVWCSGGGAGLHDFVGTCIYPMMPSHGWASMAEGRKQFAAWEQPHRWGLPFLIAHPLG